MVECQLPKLDVVGSNPISRSNRFNSLPLFSLYDGTTPIASRPFLSDFLASVVLGNLVLTCDRTDSTAFPVFERASSDFTGPMSSARNASGRFAKSLGPRQRCPSVGPWPLRMELRRRCHYAARRS